MKALALLALLLIGGDPQTNGCRVSMRPTTWVESRTVNPYTGEAPLTEVKIDVCAATHWLLRYENRTWFADGTATFSSMFTRIEVAFDPGFVTTFADFSIPSSDTQLTNGPYDGVTDFAGISGYSFTTPDTQQLFVLTAPVVDPAFFAKPFQVWIRASGTGAISATGAFTTLTDPSASAGVAFTFNPETP